MENQNQNQSQIDVNYVVKELQKSVTDLTFENIMMKAYIEQLKAEFAEATKQEQTTEEQK